MLLETNLHPSNSATSGFEWEQFDFNMCDRFAGSKYAWAASTLLCFALGFPASVVILWEMFKKHRNRARFTPNEFFILNLSIMDVSFSIFIPPGVLNHLIWKCWEVEAFWNAVYAFSVSGRPLLMACTCLDCYLAVVHPITYHQRKSMIQNMRVVMVTTVWICTLAFAISFFLFYKLFFAVVSVIPYIVAIVIIGICDSFILYTLMTSKPGRKNLQKQRTIQILTNSLVISLFSYIPPLFMIVVGRAMTDIRTFVCVIGTPMTIISPLGSVLLSILHLSNIGKLNCFRRGRFLQNQERR